MKNCSVKFDQKAVYTLAALIGLTSISEVPTQAKCDAVYEKVASELKKRGYQVIATGINMKIYFITVSGQVVLANDCSSQKIRLIKESLVKGMPKQVVDVIRELKAYENFGITEDEYPKYEKIMLDKGKPYLR